ncbi:hypothetical protein L1887_50728 [Cichorium endivia]|nr:hypothetical protein L1887_50728 [Cichorium endivia]
MTRQQKTWMLDAGQSSPDYALVHFVSPMPKQRAGPAIHAPAPARGHSSATRRPRKKTRPNAEQIIRKADVMPLRPRRAHDGGGGSSSSSSSSSSRSGQPRFKPEQDFLNQVLAPEGGKTRPAFFRASARLRPAPCPVSRLPRKFARVRLNRASELRASRSADRDFSAGSTTASLDPDSSPHGQLTRARHVPESEEAPKDTLVLACSHFFRGDTGAKVDGSALPTDLPMQQGSRDDVAAENGTAHTRLWVCYDRWEGPSRTCAQIRMLVSTALPVSILVQDGRLRRLLQPCTLWRKRSRALRWDRYGAVLEWLTLPTLVLSAADVASPSLV